MSVRGYTLSCAKCGFTRQHEGRPPVKCPSCAKPDYRGSVAPSREQGYVQPLNSKAFSLRDAEDAKPYDFDPEVA